jgi:hypothetical protein
MITDPRSVRGWMLCARELALRAAGSWVIARVIVMIVALLSRSEHGVISDPLGLPIGTVVLALVLAWLDVQRSGEARWYRLLGVSAVQISVMLAVMIALWDRLFVLVVRR